MNDFFKNEDNTFGIFMNLKTTKSNSFLLFDKKQTKLKNEVRKTKLIFDWRYLSFKNLSHKESCIGNLFKDDIKFLFGNFSITTGIGSLK